ncbi:MAG: hypothetical protein EXS36_06020 [Pedosphaera sp.]|nr:hypothetical protein [Pedosphaera sp.]
MYRLQLVSGEESGPLTAVQVCGWVITGRADAGTRVQRGNHDDWQAIGDFEEFAAAFQNAIAAPTSMTDFAARPFSGLAVLSITVAALCLLTAVIAGLQLPWFYSRGLVAGVRTYNWFGILGLLSAFLGFEHVTGGSKSLRGRNLALAGGLCSVLCVAAGVYANVHIVSEVTRNYQQRLAANPRVQRFGDLPDNQLAAKQLIVTARTLTNLPAASNWFEALGPDVADLDATGRGLNFALNASVAGRRPAGLRRDTVVFFETGRVGTNLAGGAELLRRTTGAKDRISVALADGRAMLIPGSRAGTLRWSP